MSQGGSVVKLLEKVTERLSRVKDPETGMDVVGMKLVRDLKVGEGGDVELTFRPSSVLCPRAFQLGIDIKEAVRAVPEVRRVHVEVEGFIQAEYLKRILNDAV
jgi:ATP-binding protein involved in chromosome partitioning